MIPDPHAGLRTRKNFGARGEVPVLIDLPPGCPFTARCPKVMDACRQVMPGITFVQPGHWTRCHLFGPEKDTLEKMDLPVQPNSI